MPTIRIEYEVPDDNCKRCLYSWYGSFNNLYCLMFGEFLNKDTNGGYKRFQACIGSEVKEGE